MVIEPKIRNNICLTAHPEGCRSMVMRQIRSTLKGPKAPRGPKNVLVVGASTGYGLASRISAAFGYRAATLGVFYEKPGTAKRPGTAGWYNSCAFVDEARKAGLKAANINGDAFSHAVKKEAAAYIRKEMGKIDLLVYSLASPVRTDPDSGEMYRSVLKPLKQPYSARSLDFMTGTMSQVSIEPASEEETAATVKVMGGEDWMLWIDLLQQEDLLAEQVQSLAYSYMGPQLTRPIYRDGTIGQAKKHLEHSAARITHNLKPLNGAAYVSVNKALVTRASAVIPVVPLYISLLFRVMKEKGLHEGCIEQINRLFSHRLYAENTVPVDEAGRIRMDDWEMREDVQAQVSEYGKKVSESNILEMTDLEGYRRDYLQLHGFAVPGVDYSQETTAESLCQK